MSTVESHFSREAKRYQSASTSGLWDWWRGRERAAIFALLQPRPGETILDAGSGAGYYSEWLQRVGAKPVATDLSKAMVRQVRDRLRIPAFVANLESFRMKPIFPAVLCAGALEFCPHPGRAVRCLATGLAPGGRLVVMLPALSISGRLYREFHRRHGLRIQLFSRARIAKFAAAAGLRITAFSGIGFNHVVRMERAR